MIHILINNIDYKSIYGIVQSTLNIPRRGLFLFFTFSLKDVHIGTF